MCTAPLARPVYSSSWDILWFLSNNQNGFRNNWNTFEYKQITGVVNLDTRLNLETQGANQIKHYFERMKLLKHYNRKFKVRVNEYVQENGVSQVSALSATLFLINDKTKNCSPPTKFNLWYSVLLHFWYRSKNELSVQKQLQITAKNIDELIVKRGFKFSPSKSIKYYFVYIICDGFKIKKKYDWDDCHNSNTA